MSCVTTGNKLPNKYLINRFENEERYKEVLLMLNSDYAYQAQRESNKPEVEFWGEKYEDARQRAMQRIVQNEHLYESTIIEMLDISSMEMMEIALGKIEIDQSLLRSVKTIKKPSTVEEEINIERTLKISKLADSLEAAIYAARLLYNDKYTSFIKQLLTNHDLLVELGNQAVLVESNCIYYFYPNESIGAHHEHFSDETIRNNIDYLYQLLYKKNDIHTVKSILQVIFGYNGLTIDKETLLKLETYKKDLLSIATNYSLGLLPIDNDEIRKLEDYVNWELSLVIVK